MRINRFLAYAGFGSRRKVETLIEQGRVSINGNMISEIGTDVNTERDTVTVDGEKVKLPRNNVYLMFNKPQAVITSMKRESGDRRTIVADYFKDVRTRIFPVGRLDYNTEGLLLITNDGKLADKLMHPRFHIPKTYIAKVKGKISSDELSRMRKGIKLRDGFVKPIELKILNMGKTQNNTFIRVTIDIGKNRIVRRFFDRFLHGVLKLKRTSVGPINLGSLPRGSYRRLTNSEIKALKGVAGINEE